MKKIYGLLIASIFVLSIMPMVFAVNQTFNGETVSISVNNLDFGYIFGGTSTPQLTTFTVLPDGTADNPITTLGLYVSEISVVFTSGELTNANVVFCETENGTYSGVGTDGGFKTTGLLNQYPLYVKLTGLAENPESSTEVAGTITYTISSGFKA